MSEDQCNELLGRWEGYRIGKVGRRGSNGEKPVKAWIELLPVAGPQIAVAGCRKLLRLLVALVRDGMPYEAGRLAVELKTRKAA